MFEEALGSGARSCVPADEPALAKPASADLECGTCIPDGGLGTWMPMKCGCVDDECDDGPPSLENSDSEDGDEEAPAVEEEEEKADEEDSGPMRADELQPLLQALNVILTAPLSTHPTEKAPTVAAIEWKKDAKGGWTTVKTIPDTGAKRNVAPKKMAPEYKIEPSAMSREERNR